jgi:hypothetical protein
VEQEIEQQLRPGEEQPLRLEQITGVSRHKLHLLCAEEGLDLSAFPMPPIWRASAGMCPGHKEKCSIKPGILGAA